MNNFTSIIVDDEKNSRIVLKELIKKYCPKVSIIGEADNVEEAYKEIQNKKPDIIFLDIQMPTGNGFTLLQKFDPIPFQIIFVTSHNQYAINAIKFNALDYILKPIDIDELKTAIEKAMVNKRNRNNHQQQIINLVNILDPSTGEKKIFVHEKENVRLINISDVSYIQGEINYSKITTIQNEVFISTKTLKEFEEYFFNQKYFLRMHKSCIVNIHQIKTYSKADPCLIIMTDGKEFEVSRRKKNEFLTRLKS